MQQGEKAPKSRDRFACRDTTLVTYGVCGCQGAIFLAESSHQSIRDLLLHHRSTPVIPARNGNRRGSSFCLRKTHHFHQQRPRMPWTSEDQQTSRCGSPLAKPELQVMQLLRASKVPLAILFVHRAQDSGLTGHFHVAATPLIRSLLTPKSLQVNTCY